MVAMVPNASSAGALGTLVYYVISKLTLYTPAGGGSLPTLNHKRVEIGEMGCGARLIVSQDRDYKLCVNGPAESEWA